MPEKIPNNLEQIQYSFAEKTDVKEIENKKETKEESLDILVPVQELVPGINLGEIEKFRPKNYKNSCGEKFDDYFVGKIWKTINPQIFRNKIKKCEQNQERIQSIRERRVFDDALSHFQDQIVVDLGAGNTFVSYYIMTLIGAKGYVGVDKFHVDTLKSHLKYKDFKKYAKDEFAKKHMGEVKFIPASVVKEDMLTFLKRLPSDSVSIFTSGVDSHVIPNNEYRNAVEQEMARVLHPKGACVSFDSAFHPNKLKECSTDNSKRTWDLFVYKK